jgi:hypothetical protein
MTELSWLLDLLINHKLTKETKQHVLDRIHTIEQKAVFNPYVTANSSSSGLTQIVNGAPQAASTVALMQKHGLGAPTTVSITPDQPTEPGVVAATAQTQAAVASRQAAIDQALSGKLEKGRTSPRKF